MKVLLAVFDLSKQGGKERDCLAVGKFLADRGHDVTLVSTASGSEVVVPFRYKILPRSGFSNHARAAAFAGAVIKYCAAAKPDVLLAFEKIPGADYYYAADSAIGSRSRNVFSWPGRRLAFQRLEWGVLEGDARTHIFFLTERQRDEYALIYGFDRSRSSVLPLVLHDERYEEAKRLADRTRIREELGLPRDAIVAVSLAVVPKQKGADRTLAALADFPDLHLVIAGSSDSWVKRQVRALKLEQRVRVIPYITKVVELFSAADFLLHPARVEAAGQVIAEALLAGTPAIVTENCGYASEVKRSGAGIVLPEPFEQTALVSGISNVMEQLSVFRNAAAAESERQQLQRSRWLRLIADEVENRFAQRAHVEVVAEAR